MPWPLVRVPDDNQSIQRLAISPPHQLKLTLNYGHLAANFGLTAILADVSPAGIPRSPSGPSSAAPTVFDLCLQAGISF
jgi:hypothetical protein